MATVTPRVLITGGMGFIGIHTVQRWKAAGWDVTIIDNLSANVIDIDHPILDDVRIIAADLQDVDFHSLPDLDLIIHLASPVGTVGVLKYPGKMASMILGDTDWVVKLARQRECPLIFVSTSEIYGHRDGKTTLPEESDKVLRGDFTVRNEYAIAKLLAEIVVSNVAKVDDSLLYQIIRPFNVTGAFQQPDNGFALPRFVTQALDGAPITVYNDGEQARAFTHVVDIVHGIWLTANAPDHLWNQQWNIGHRANETTINYLADKVKAVTGSASDIIHIDPTLLHGVLFAEAPEKIPDADKAETLLDWQGTYDVDSIIDDVVAYWRQVRQSAQQTR